MKLLHNPIFTIFLIFQCPPSAANTTHVSGNFAQDYIWYILRTKVETWESFVYHNFYFYYFLSLAKTACFLHHQQPDNLKMRDTAADMSQKLFNFSRVLTMMVGFNRQHCQTKYYPPWKRKLEPHRGSMEMKEFVENSASQRGECLESVLPQKGSLVGAED